MVMKMLIEMLLICNISNKAQKSTIYNTQFALFYINKTQWYTFRLNDNSDKKDIVID